MPSWNLFKIRSASQRSQAGAWVWLVLLLATAAALAGAWFFLVDPRTKLGWLDVPFNRDSFIDQAGEGDLAAVKLFLKAGMNVNSTDKEGTSALLSAAAGGHFEIVRILLQRGSDPNFEKESSGLTPLGAAAWEGHVDVARALIDKGADVQAGGSVQASPLMLATRAHRPNLVQLLLENGAHAYIQDDKWSALMLASFLGDQAIVAILLTKDPNINSANNRGMNSLMFAASRGHTLLIRTLLAKGADPNAVDSEGRTALMFAANNGHADAVKALIEEPVLVLNQSGADAAARLAAINGHGEIAGLLAKTRTEEAERGRSGQAR